MGSSTSPHYSSPSPIDLGYGETSMEEDLGYGDEKTSSVKVVSVSELGYGEDTTNRLPGIKDLGYGEETTTSPATPRFSKAKSAIQIRNGKRSSPMLGPYASGNASSGSIDSYYASSSDDEDYDDSSIDYSDDEDEDEPDEYEESMQDLTELTVDLGDEQDMDAANPHMPSQVNMEFNGNSAAPRRISLTFSQHKELENGRSRTRTGCLEVSIGTSRLPRRRATMSHDQSRNNEEPVEIIRGLKKNHSNLTVSTRPMRRLSMEHSHPSVPCSTYTGKATRRITMNLCSRPSRRGSLGTPVDRQAPSATLSGTGKRSPLRRRPRRPTMEYSTPTVPLSTQATRRISMDMTRGGSQRRISMNLTKSVLPRAPPTATQSGKPTMPRRRTCCMARSA